MQPVRKPPGTALKSNATPPKLSIVPLNTFLTKHQKQVALLAAEGWTDEKIGKFLFVNKNTVQSHLGAVYEKLKVSGRVQMTATILANPRVLTELQKKRVSTSQKEISFYKSQRLRAALLVTEIIGNSKDANLLEDLQKVLALLQP